MRDESGYMMLLLLLPFHQQRKHQTHSDPLPPDSEHPVPRNSHASRRGNTDQTLFGPDINKEISPDSSRACYSPHQRLCPGFTRQTSRLWESPIHADSAVPWSPHQPGPERRKQRKKSNHSGLNSSPAPSRLQVMEAIWLYQFRLIVIGDSTVGKSCLIRRFTEGRFAQVSDPTVGVDFFSRLVEIEPGKRIKLQIWDTAGQERFRSITRAYYRNSVGGLLLFDITNRRSFQNVHDWLEEARSHVQPHSIVFLLVGHKCDLEAQRQVTRQEAEKLAGAYGMRYVETSARDAINVEHAFTELTRDIFALVRSGDITIQEGWEGVKSGFVPNVVHSSEEVTKSDRRCLC
ncbi:hypothetical protein FQN60_006350 [Etheostoma spectabile]|nr:hypothetical protein FQN60_006350 [Etheostoma spectabile]